VASHQQLSDVLQNFLMDYNQMAKRQMELVLFLSAVEHVCRIVRVLKTPLGNALLVGVGGSGRKSLATLATFVADYESLRIEISKSYGSAWAARASQPGTCPALPALGAPRRPQGAAAGPGRLQEAPG
ncbi:unnamed protein product, partial [Prorocentrum cordatum]